LIDHLLRRRVILTLGKGGVGRTSVASAISLLAARRGLRTLLMETDPRRPVADSYGHRPGLEPVALEQPHLWSLFLGGKESLEDYLRMAVPGPLLRKVFASSLYQRFVNAAPALRELTMMGKIYHEIERRPKTKLPWDLIVVDAPASGQALGMLRMPFVAHRLFGSGLVASEAAEVAGFFRNPTKCAIILVATSELLAISEALEIHDELQKLHLATSAVFFNRMSNGMFDASDIDRMIAAISRSSRLKHLEQIAEIARADLRRRIKERRALAMVQRRISAPLAIAHEQLDCSRRKLAAALATEFAAGPESLGGDC
jgi:arsenite-transporting ATPase